MRQSLLETEQEYGISFEKYRLFDHVIRHFYIDAEMIRKTRNAVGMTQEKLSEDICAQETLARVETGRQTPQSRKLQQMMEKMGRGCGAIGFAVYLAQLERFGRQTPAFDTDALILYDEASDPALIIRTARSWTDMGKTVRVQRQRGDLRCRQLIKIGAKEVSILETND